MEIKALRHVIKGAKHGPNTCAPPPLSLTAHETGHRIVRLIGYACGPADPSRAGSAADADADFDCAYRYNWRVGLAQIARTRSRSGWALTACP